MWKAWLRTDGYYEFVNIVDGHIVNKSGLTSKDLSVVVNMADYINFGYSGKLPPHICRDLDYICSQGVDYCPCKIKIPWI